MEPSPETVPLPSSVDVAVVGGGVVGIACGRELARRGARVLVLERERVGYGCSFGNAGWLTPSLALPLANPDVVFKSFLWLLDPESPLYVQPRLEPAFLRWLAGFLLASRRDRFAKGAAALIELVRVSVDLWEELSRRTSVPFGFERHGLIQLHESQASLDASRRSVELLTRNGLRAELWSADEVREREPAIVGPQVGGWFFPDDAHCEPYPAGRPLAADALEAGVQIAEEAEVYDVSANGSRPRLLRTTRGDLAADRVVLAAGAWSEDLGKAFGLRVPILGAKGYSLVLPRLEPHPTHSIYMIARKIAVNPHAHALRVSGTLELVRNDFSINQRRVSAILRGAQGMLAIPKQPVVREVWRGLRPCAPDGMPLIGRARGNGDVWLATGHQMTGLKAALGSGRLLAELMAGAAPSFDPEPFRADRY